MGGRERLLCLNLTRGRAQAGHSIESVLLVFRKPFAFPVSPRVVRHGGSTPLAMECILFESDLLDRYGSLCCLKLPNMRNMTNQDNRMRMLRRCFARGCPTARTDLDKVDGTRDDKGADARCPDGRSACLANLKRSLQPRGVLVLRAHLQHLAEQFGSWRHTSESIASWRPVWGSRPHRERAGRAQPARPVHQAPEVNPDRAARPSRSLRGGKAGRIVRRPRGTTRARSPRSPASTPGTDRGTRRPGAD